MTTLVKTWASLAHSTLAMPCTHRPFGSWEKGISTIVWKSMEKTLASSRFRYFPLRENVSLARGDRAASSPSPYKPPGFHCDVHIQIFNSFTQLSFICILGFSSVASISVRVFLGDPLTDPAMATYEWDDTYNNSSFNQEDIQDLANRTDIDEEEKKRRRHKLEEEVAAGVVGGGILGYAGFRHDEKKEAKEAEEASGEKKHHHLF